MNIGNIGGYLHISAIIVIEIEMNANDDEVKHDDDNQQYTVHVQAIPEPMTLPVVHVPARNTLQVPKTCSTTKHLPRLVQTESNNNHHCSSHLGNIKNRTLLYTHYFVDTMHILY